MKIKKNESIAFERLVKCAGQDKKKPAYQVVYSDNESGYLVTTDGFRLFATRDLPLAPETGTYQIKEYAEKEKFVKAKTEFPCWKSLIPQSFEYEAKFRVPSFVEDLSPKGKKHRALVALTFSPGGEDFKIEVLLDSELPENKDQFCMDLALLQLLANTDLKIIMSESMQRNKTTAAIIDPSFSKNTELLSCPWFMLVHSAHLMHLQDDSYETEVTEEAKAQEEIETK